MHSSHKISIFFAKASYIRNTREVVLRRNYFSRAKDVGYLGRNSLADLRKTFNGISNRIEIRTDYR